MGARPQVRAQGKVGDELSGQGDRELRARAGRRPHGAQRGGEASKAQCSANYVAEGAEIGGCQVQLAEAVQRKSVVGGPTHGGGVDRCGGR
jgi:hypothetical protein